MSYGSALWKAHRRDLLKRPVMLSEQLLTGRKANRVA